MRFSADKKKRRRLGAPAARGRGLGARYAGVSQDPLATPSTGLGIKNQKIFGTYFGQKSNVGGDMTYAKPTGLLYGGSCAYSFNC